MDTVKQYLQLCWFDANPLDLPKSADFLKLNILFYEVVQYFLQANMTDDPLESFYEVILELLFTLSFIGVMLLFDKKLYAYIQVTTAILFCTNVLSILFIPIIVWLTVSDEPLSYYMMCILVLWFYALITHVIKATLAINLFASSSLSLLYFTVVYLSAFALGQM
ncbi:MAG: hypothetical protein LUP96_08945 [Methylococcaceae bacterium]|nr:hypothetical protein [Methylococcaceae bacterium]